MKKTIKLFILLALPFVIFYLVIYFGWIFSEPHRDKYDEIPCKEIYIDQKTDSILTIVVYGYYTEEEARIYNQPDLGFYVDSTSAGYQGLRKCPTGMLRNNTIPFPKSFKIKIYHETNGKLIKEYDYDAFIKEIQKDSTLKDIDPLSLDNWTLVLDSTLFEK
jgi:hypothetical protein